MPQPREHGPLPQGERDLPLALSVIEFATFVGHSLIKYACVSSAAFRGRTDSRVTSAGQNYYPANFMA
ncbi:hypothetical protein PSCICL_26670 [Pseudomonas cichorii]|nr:hypothetical protein PSCICE_46740 [Pseudomonas cichorii]GFM60859.1 hypothetical protein PSCICG_20190 [Pseudomonas cichorii]GFM71675.1 hypothetical protein PSCICL_26670 [Pseudomonas cichorii]